MSSAEAPAPEEPAVEEKRQAELPPTEVQEGIGALLDKVVPTTKHQGTFKRLEHEKLMERKIPEPVKLPPPKTKKGRRAHKKDQEDAREGEGEGRANRKHSGKIRILHEAL